LPGWLTTTPSPLRISAFVLVLVLVHVLVLANNTVRTKLGSLSRRAAIRVAATRKGVSVR
jgi:hypothetical protein